MTYGEDICFRATELLPPHAVDDGLEVEVVFGQELVPVFG